MPSASDIPGKFDVVINSQGYMFVEPEQPRARYGYSPTFIERQNVGSQWGDDQQDFFLTASQTDWSLGEERRYNSDLSDADTGRRYFTGTSVDPLTVPGQVSMRYTMASVSFGEAVIACCAHPANGTIFAAGATHLYEVASDGTVTDRGAHGLSSNLTTPYGLATDGSNVFIAQTGATNIRRWNGSAFANVSGGQGGGVTYLGNTLYMYDGTSSGTPDYRAALLSLVGGTATTLYQWKDYNGAFLTGTNYQARLRPFGGSVLVLRKGGSQRPVELWEYDGTSTSQRAELPTNFLMGDMIVVGGVVYIAGYLSRNNDKLPCILYYLNGSIGQLWVAKTAGYTNSTWPGICAWQSGIAFTDDTQGKLMYYDLPTGSIHTMGSYTVTNGASSLAATGDFILHIRNSTTGWRFPTTTLASTSTVVSSLWDFGNSLTKQFRGIKVDYDAASGGGGSVDIAYQTGSVDGSWTTLQTGAASGTEYTLSGVSGSSIATKITLNKGTSAGPILKKVYVRGAPQLSQYRNFSYVIDCSGRDGTSNIKLRNGQPHPLDGQTMANNLKTAITSTSPISITDRFGTFTAFLEPDKCEFREIAPEEYVAIITGRQV